MKKHLHNSLRALFLSLAVLLCLPMLAVEVEIGEIGGINYFLVAEKKQAYVMAKSSGKYSGSIVIPESVKHEGTAYSVTAIGEYAFYDCSGLTSVTIPNSVTIIGEEAFYNCEELSSVYIYDIESWCNIYFEEYESNPLHYAHHLYLNGNEVKNLVIPNSVTSIEDYAFRGCSGLTSVTIPNSVTSIGRCAFDGCSGLTSVAIPDSVTSIGYYAFRKCSGLTSVTIGNSVTSIGDEAFRECSGLTSVTIPNSVTSIERYAFLGCSGLTSVTIPNSVTRIGEYAFEECSGLTSVTIGNSVTRIGEGAFSICSGLTSVTIPNSVTSIGLCAFSGCSGLTSIVVAEDNSRYDSRDNCNAIIETQTNTLIVGCSETTIPNSVTGIGDFAFSGCSGLTSVTIPNSVTSIGKWAFSGCPELLDVYCHAEKVPSTGIDIFGNSPIQKVTLHVPAASIDNYKATEPWRSFGKIVALTDEDTGIENIDANAENSVIYDLNGRRVQNAQKGIYIKNGKKVIVK